MMDAERTTPDRVREDRRDREALARGVRARVDVARWELREAEREEGRWAAKVRGAREALARFEANLRELEASE